jgi:dCTP deaminase
MGVLCDTQIRELVGIEPFEAGAKRPGTISYGVSSYGYDVRVGTRFKIFTNATTGGAAVIDPKSFNPELFISVDTSETGRDHIIIPPNSFALAETVEHFAIPRDVLAICVGKSTYARCGIIVNVTPLEPEWRGKVTIEISNTTPLPAKIYANEGIAQMVFIKADRVCQRSYADKDGKYQDQRGLTLPMVDGPMVDGPMVDGPMVDGPRGGESEGADRDGSTPANSSSTDIGPTNSRPTNTRPTNSRPSSPRVTPASSGGLNHALHCHGTCDSQGQSVELLSRE